MAPLADDYPDLLAALDLQLRVERAEAEIRETALARPDPLVLLEAGVRRLSEALQGRPSAAYVAGDDALVRCAVWPPDMEAPVEIPVGTALDALAPAAIGPQDHGDLLPAMGESAALRVPFEGAAEGMFVVAGASDAAEMAAAARFAALFSTLWAWTEAEARFQRTVADLDDALFTFTYDPDGERRYAFVTPQVEHIAGLPAHTLTANEVNWEALVDDTDAEAFAEHDARLQAGDPSRLDYRLRDINGEIRWISERATPSLDAAGRFAIGGILSDITERKVAEATLVRARQTAERAARTRMSFLRMMSHELRTPLGAIRGFAEILEDEVQALDGAPEEIGEFAHTIAEASDKALRLVSSLLDLSRVETGALDLARQPVDLDALSAGVATKYAAQATAKHLALHVERASEPAIVHADPSRLEQVVDGLLSNAVKFTEAGEVRVRIDAGAAEARLVVSDTGIGIGEAFVDGLFEPFSQEDHRVNRKFEGSGLGLAIAAGLVKAMEGRIEVETEQGVGSTFTVTLPAIRRAE
ncbi:MAG: PAS domain-containing sensor histidine kinase [Bacteroidota bacterium]